jgi:hypothetical protein
MARSAKFNPKVGDLVYFRWLDHCTYDGKGWLDIKEKIIGHLSPSVCETVGFVVEIDRNNITTVAHIAKDYFDDKDEDGSHVATRLRSCIIDGKIIKRFLK